MLEARIIETVEELNWVSLMVVQRKKQWDEISTYVDLRKLNDVCIHDPFPMLFRHEVLENDGDMVAYSLTDGFLGYHQIKVLPEDSSKTTFVIEWGCFQYIVMPFGLNNAPMIVSRVVIVHFKESIHKFLEIYFNDWTIFGLAKCHVASLCYTLDTYHRH